MISVCVSDKIGRKISLNTSGNKHPYKSSL